MLMTLYGLFCWRFFHITGLNSQQDNARPHTARVTIDCLQSCRTLPWPARSSNLSPIEHIWDVMERTVKKPVWNNGDPLRDVGQTTGDTKQTNPAAPAGDKALARSMRILNVILPQPICNLNINRELTGTILRIITEHFKRMKINPDMTRSYRNCNNCHNTQLTPDHIYPAILAVLYMADINPEENIHTNKAPQLADIVIRVHGPI
ncbi:hypothetical protein LAZ67_18000534 [Cordylochernes scorpioides]|uniref:Uncharacterized protein n=1 Tax=Cordylochernes scorpioides TaxID=51811 RepID=A0ABY6LIN6_9ARAC|nr:hypothetical protein LAZ67_18000534 [Cordylochernes scorpioides]